MPTETEIGRIAAAALPPGTMRQLPRPPFHVLVANVGGAYYAIEDACPHSGQSLSEGTLSSDDPCVTCAGHGWVIDLRDGRVRTEVGRGEANPAFRAVREGDEVVVYAD